MERNKALEKQIEDTQETQIENNKRIKAQDDVIANLTRELEKLKQDKPPVETGLQD